MPSRSNPNTPSHAKAKTASVLKSKRKHNQRSVKNRVNKPSVPRTSQALRKAALLSRKKARKLEKKDGYARQRKEMAQYLEADVDMKDIDQKEARKSKQADIGAGTVKMDLDVAE